MSSFHKLSHFLRGLQVLFCSALARALTLGFYPKTCHNFLTCTLPLPKKRKSMSARGTCTTLAVLPFSRSNFAIIPRTASVLKKKEVSCDFIQARAGARCRTMLVQWTRSGNITGWSLFCNFLSREQFPLGPIEGGSALNHPLARKTGEWARDRRRPLKSCH